MQLIAEMKRRKVFRVAAAYAVSAWALAQVADLVLENTAAPPWVMQVILLVLALGFPLAVLLAWAFEVTPDGVKRTQALEQGESPPALGVQDRMLIALMLAVVAIAVYQFAAMPNTDVTASGRGVLEATTTLDDSTTPAPNQGSASIAVLAFENMSPDPDNAYFADGISEELLNILAEIEGLKVASRTSAFSFKGSGTPIPQIAEQLGVRHVLEGSVRKQGNRVRITAQLIEAGDDVHLWSESYDRELDDIFAVQEEIARSITGELESLLGTRSVDVAAPTRNMDAYQLYLRGRSRFYARTELNEAVEDLRTAVDQDPEFAEAWAFLAALCWLHGNGGYPSDYDRAEMTRLAVKASERASVLKAEIPIALAVQGQIAADSGAPDAVANAIRLLERAVALSTVDTTPRLWLSLLWLELGHAERALPLLETARQIDPLIGINAGVAGVAHATENRFADAERLILEAIDLNGLTFWGDLIVLNYFQGGNVDRATRLNQTILDRLDPSYKNELSPTLAMREGVADPSSRERLFHSGAWARSDLAVASLMFDGGRRAFELAASDPNRAWGILMSAWLPAMQWLREDPRYFELMDSDGRVEYWNTHGYPHECRPVDGPDGRHLACPEVFE